VVHQRLNALLEPLEPRIHEAKDLSELTTAGCNLLTFLTCGRR
jgi:hypothetical protein